TQDVAVTGADAVVRETEWKEFRSPDFTRLKAELKAPVIFDGRNLYEPDAMAELGIDYYAIGRPYVDPQLSSRG
ncbi:UDP binding domain-containing protein, partial [Burkholderia cenocepacia]|nr:UDP binding domain-containing protein [Burkholderia cenocepacia]